MNKASFVVPRLDLNDGVLAIVEADVEFNPTDFFFLKKIRAAIAGWIRKTEEGREAWECSAEDFNVGDLSLCDYDTDSPLGQELAAVGIHNLKISTTCTSLSVWHYDTVLGTGPKESEHE